MNEVLKKLLKELGIDDATLEKVFAENVEPATVEAIFPDITKMNRAKWENILSNDTRWTEPFTARGHSAGSAAAYQKIKDEVLRNLGLQIDPNSEEYKDNAKFSAKLKEQFEAAKKTTEGGDGKQKEELARIQAEFERKMQDAITKERETLAQQHAQQIKGIKQEHGFESELLGYGMGKKMKGGLALQDLLPAIKAKTSAYKWEFDENGKLVKVLGQDGHELDNHKGDGKLSPIDVLGKIYEPFIDLTTGDDSGDGKDQRQGDGGRITTLTGSLSEMAGMQD